MVLGFRFWVSSFVYLFRFVLGVLCLWFLFFVLGGVAFGEFRGRGSGYSCFTRFGIYGFGRLGYC